MSTPSTSSEAAELTPKLAFDSIAVFARRTLSLPVHHKAGVWALDDRPSRHFVDVSEALARNGHRSGDGKEPWFLRLPHEFETFATPQTLRTFNAPPVSGELAQTPLNRRPRRGAKGPPEEGGTSCRCSIRRRTQRDHEGYVSG
jgi:hypothetical protein